MLNLKKALIAASAVAMLAGCSSAASSSSKASSAKESSSAKETEKPATDADYTITNNTGEKVTALYVYKTGTEDKGTNYAEAGLSDGDSVEVKFSVKESEAEGYASTVEFTTESGETATAFETLHIETAPLYLKPVADVEGGATPFSK
jgi:Flp pilus assembly protein TadD